MCHPSKKGRRHDEPYCSSLMSPTVCLSLSSSHWNGFYYRSYVIGYWHDNVICRSVRLSVTLYAKRYILQQKCLNKWIGSDLFKTILQLSTPYTDPIPSNFHFLNHRHWYHLANTLKNAVNERTAEISTSGIAIVSMLHGYFRQRRTIGSFSATAGLLVKLLFVLSALSMPRVTCT